MLANSEIGRCEVFRENSLHVNHVFCFTKQKYVIVIHQKIYSTICGFLHEETIIYLRLMKVIIFQYGRKKLISQFRCLTKSI